MINLYNTRRFKKDKKKCYFEILKKFPFLGVCVCETAGPICLSCPISPLYSQPLAIDSIRPYPALHRFSLRSLLGYTLTCAT
jgi:hypothetical protein